MGKHTIMLVQLRGKTSRTYFDYDNEAAAINELIKMFEQVPQRRAAWGRGMACRRVGQPPRARPTQL